MNSSTLENHTQHDFSAEVDRVLEIVTHALYQHRDIFLRELLSNAADAMDKRRFLALSDPSVLEDPIEDPHDTPTIEILLNTKEHSLSIKDRGIGMTPEEMAENLGTIARSGTKKFLEATQKEKEEAKELPQLIGQFGMGFYASFMVAETVEVFSKKANTQEVAKWQSDGKKGYVLDRISADTAKTYPIGTEVKVWLKKDAHEFTNADTVRKTVETYARHIGIPITLRVDDGEEETLQEGDALWRRPPAEIKEEEIQQFYRGHIDPFGQPWASVHKTLEGLKTYTMMLFIPQNKPFDLFSQEFKSGIKLYVQKVFITDELEGILPGYLRFVRGIVETDDMPLNVSRETVQDSPIIPMMKKGVTKQILQLLTEKSEKDSSAYQQFWQTFGAVLKEGLYAMDGEHEQLFKLARFRSSLHPDEWISLSTYCERMQEGQDSIYTITAETLSQALASPQLEGYTSKNIEVLILTDPIDSFWTASRSTYQDKPFVSVTRAELSAENKPKGDADDRKDEEQNSETQSIEKDFEPLLKAMHDALKEQVTEVRISERLTKSPVCLVAPGQGLDIHMERLMRAQGNATLPTGPRHILEINNTHALIKALKEKSEKGEDITPFTHILYEQARLLAGENIEKPTDFVDAVNSILSKAI